MTQPAIVIEQLQFRWHPAQEHVLDIPHWQINAEQRVFIQGASGSGKSTLLNLIGGVLKPQRGSIRVLGTPLQNLSGARRDRFRADHIGFIFQMFNLIPYLTVLDNVLLPCRFSKRRANRGNPHQQAQQLLTRLGLEQSLFAQPANQLSVGQQQRVAAARALIGQPELVIADEPTSALDTNSRDAFLDLIMEQCAAQGSTLLFVSHDPTLQSHFDSRFELADINRSQPVQIPEKS